MKKCGYTSTTSASKPVNELGDTMNSSSIDSTTSDVLRSDNLNCQPFSMRGYVAEKRNTNPEACIPFDGMNENTWEQLRGSLDVPRFRWWRCRSCVGEAVTSSTTAQDSPLELSVVGGSLEKNDTKPPTEAITMVESIGEQEIPDTVPLEQLARVAAGILAYDYPQLLETSQTEYAEKDSSYERNTEGSGTDAIIEEGDKAFNVFTDVIDNEDEREHKKTRLLKDLMRVEEKASVGKVVTPHTLRTEEMASSCKGKNILSEVKGQEFVRSQRSRKVQRSCSFLPDTDQITSKHAKATGSFSQPLSSRNRRKSNGGK